MDKNKLTALLLAAAMSCGIFTACGDKNGKGSSDSSETTSAVSEEEAATFDSESYKDIIMKDIEKAKESDKPLKFGTLGDLVTPDKDNEEADLGSYYSTENGIKLYFDKADFPEELMLTLEQYFCAFANADYTTYSRCVYPGYMEKMNEYLKKDFEYDIKESFAIQCSNLANITNGKFNVTRIKMDVPQQYDESKDNLEAYFERFTEILGEGYYEKLKKDVDKVYDGEFYVMGENRLGTESLLVSAYEIVMVEKDGRYYVFG